MPYSTSPDFWADYDSDDGCERAYYDGWAQLDIAWADFLQAHGYQPNDTITNEHLIEYWNSVWHIGELQ